MLLSKTTQASNTALPALSNHSLASSHPTAPAEASSSPSLPPKLIGTLSSKTTLLQASNTALPAPSNY